MVIVPLRMSKARCASPPTTGPTAPLQYGDLFGASPGPTNLEGHAVHHVCSFAGDVPLHGVSCAVRGIYSTATAPLMLWTILALAQPGCVEDRHARAKHGVE